MNEPQLYLENVDAFIRTLFVNGSMRSLNNDDVNAIKNMTKNMEHFIKDYPEYEEYNNIKTRLNNNPSLLNPEFIQYVENSYNENNTLSDLDKNRLLSYVDRAGGKKRNRRTNRRRSGKKRKSRGGKKSKKRRIRHYIGGSNECSICMEPILNWQSTCSHIIDAGKKHTFHSECLNGWLFYGENECPKCRAKLNYNGKRNLEGPCKVKQKYNNRGERIIYTRPEIPPIFSVGNVVLFTFLFTFCLYVYANRPME